MVSLRGSAVLEFDQGLLLRLLPELHWSRVLGPWGSKRAREFLKSNQLLVHHDLHGPLPVRNSNVVRAPTIELRVLLSPPPRAAVPVSASVLLVEAPRSLPLKAQRQQWTGRCSFKKPTRAYA